MPNSNWPEEHWLFDAQLAIIDKGLYVFGTEFLKDGETQVVQEWHLIPEGFKELTDFDW